MGFPSGLKFAIIACCRPFKLFLFLAMAMGVFCAFIVSLLFVYYHLIVLHFDDANHVFFSYVGCISIHFTSKHPHTNPFVPKHNRIGSQ